MKYSTILALAAPVLALAKPMGHLHLHKRADGVTVTVYEEFTTTVDVTITLEGPAPDNQAHLAVDNLVKPKVNDAVPSPESQKKEEKHAKPAQPPKPTPKPNPPKLDTKPEAKVQNVQHEKPAQAPPQQAKPAPKPAKIDLPHPAPPAPKPVKQPEQKQAVGNQGSSAPSGGACGQVGGKCLASDVTIYNDQGTGACGWQNDTNSEDYFALAFTQWDSFTNDAPGPHKNKWCGRTAMIQVGGKTVEGMLTDKCPGCSGWSIDLSQSLWNKVFDGEAPTRKHDITWWFSGPQIYNGPG